MKRQPFNIDLAREIVEGRRAGRFVDERGNAACIYKIFCTYDKNYIEYYADGCVCTITEDHAMKGGLFIQMPKEDTPKEAPDLKPLALDRIAAALEKLAPLADCAQTAADGKKYLATI